MSNDESLLDSPDVRPKFLEIRMRIRKEADKGSRKLNRWAIMNSFLELLDLLKMIEITRLIPKIERKRVLYTYRVNPKFVDEIRSALQLARISGRRPARVFLNFFYSWLGYGFTPIEMSYGVRALYTVLDSIHGNASKTDVQAILRVTKPIIEDFEERFITEGKFYSIGILHWITGHEPPKKDSI